ncbi:MAG: hypothetical protein KGI54_07240 [Pseudomonadota bacterium]|nr:hypothetical protein [Pseudomonadota bacterium]
MTEQIDKDLAEVVRLCKCFTRGNLKGTTITDIEMGCVSFFSKHHAEIAQNAEDAKRLKALERAMEETGDAASIQWARKRADEILRDLNTTEKSDNINK